MVTAVVQTAPSAEMADQAERAGYKHTEAGVIPKDWQVVTLGAAVDFLDGQRRPVKAADRQKMKGNIPYYGASGIIDYVNNYIFNEDLILLGEDGENIISREVRLAFRISGKSWVNNHAHVLRPHEGINHKYLSEYLESINYELYNSGTAQPKLNKKTCNNIPVALPPNAREQDAIADALEDADALVVAFESLIQKKRLIKQGAMQELLSGRLRLPGFSGNWQKAPLGTVADISTGNRNNQDKVPNGRYPFFVRSQNIERINSYSFNTEAILIPGEGGIGNIFHYVNGKFDVHQRVYAIRNFSEGVFPKFIYHFMKQYFGPHAMKNTVKATVDSLRLPTFLSFNVAFPPTRKEQIAIANTLSDMDAELDALEAGLKKARQIKHGMMQSLLTGRVRLV